MANALYVCLQDEDRIAAYALDAASGKLNPRQSLPVAGGPSVLALSPDRRVLYVGHRSGQQIDQVIPLEPFPAHRRPPFPRPRHGAIP